MDHSDINLTASISSINNTVGEVAVTASAGVMVAGTGTTTTGRFAWNNTFASGLVATAVFSSKIEQHGVINQQLIHEEFTLPFVLRCDDELSRIERYRFLSNIFRIDLFGLAEKAPRGASYAPAGTLADGTTKHVFTGYTDLAHFRRFKKKDCYTSAAGCRCCKFEVTYGYWFLGKKQVVVPSEHYRATRGSSTGPIVLGEGSYAAALRAANASNEQRYSTWFRNVTGLRTAVLPRNNPTPSVGN